MSKSYYITLQNDTGGPSGILVATAEVDGNDVLLTFSSDWQSRFPESSEEYELLKAALLNSVECHSMQGHHDLSGLLINAWRLHIQEIAL